MCLRITENFKTRKVAREFAADLKVTKTNKTVYKVLIYYHGINLYVGPYQRTEYEPNELKTVKKFGIQIKTFGYHLWKIEIEKGLHACTTLDSAIRLAQYVKNPTIIKCIIPKGTPYFINNDKKEIVTLALQMPKVFKQINKWK